MHCPPSVSTMATGWVGRPKRRLGPLDETWSYTLKVSTEPTIRSRLLLWQRMCHHLDAVSLEHADVDVLAPASGTLAPFERQRVSEARLASSCP